jgi:dTDP-4-amino-4,6-dideoxygalactose transaminase
MEAIAKLGREYGFRIVEDASHALGATHRNSPVGACLYSDITTTSFHPVKIVTTGEGGMLLTRSAEIADRVTRLRSHGINRDPAHMSGDGDGAWYYEQIELGFNYRMTDLQAALGESQIGRLSSFVDRRRFLARRYRERLSELPLRMPSADDDETSAWHLFVIRVDEQRRRQVFDSLRSAGIGVNVHYIPVHLQPYYRQLGFTVGQYPEAEKYYREAITLPLYPAMSDDDQDIVITALERDLR